MASVARTQRQPHRRSCSAFTLLEIVLAIGLCAAVMALLATAIDLYLLRVDRNRTQVESAQLARAILAQIADDIRAVRFFTESGGNQGRGSSSGGSSGGSSFGSSTSSAALNSTSTGIFGTATELRVDRSAVRSWQRSTQSIDQIAQLQGTVAAELPSTVDYFFSEGRAITPEQLAAGGLPAEQGETGYSGLYRRQAPTSSRQLNSSAALQSISLGTQGSEQAMPKLLAPEVTELQFAYFDGQQWLDQWDTAQQGALPQAIEIHLSLLEQPLEAALARRTSDEEAARRDTERWVEYRLLVRVPQFTPPPQVEGLSQSSSSSGDSQGSGNGSGRGNNDS